MPGILVWALNPCIDAEWRTDGVRSEEKNAILSERRWAGGKGVNVSRWLVHLGVKCVLLLPLGGSTGRELRRLLTAEHLPFKPVVTRQETRTNTLITPPRGPQYRFNSPGPRLLPHDRQLLGDCAGAIWRTSKLQILSGSLPRKTAPTEYARLIRLGRRHGVLSVLDCDGAALQAAVAAGPLLVKPNEFELSQWAGVSFSSEAAMVKAARQLSVATGGWVLVSRGSQGAVLVNAGERIAFKAAAPKVEPLNTLGAGDALLAGAVSQLAGGAPPEEWLRWGVATGTAATQTKAGELPSLALVRRVLARTQATRLRE